MVKVAFPARIMIGATAAFCAVSSGAFAKDTPTEGGNFILLQSAFPPCLDVAQSARAQNATRQALDTLFDQDRNSGEIIPWLATGYRYENDGKRLILTLRDDVTFSNGEKFDAKAVKDNFDNLNALGAAGKASQAIGYLAGYTGADVIDDHTVALNFDVTKAGFLQALTEKTLAPLAPETLAKSPEDRCAGQLIATGPFVIADVVKGDRIVLKRRDDYAWASANALHNGPAWLDTVTFQTVAEGGVRLGALLSDQAQAADGVLADDIEQVEAAGGQIVSTQAGGIGLSFYPNLTRPILADAAVRQALQKGINRTEIVEGLYTPHDRAASSIISHRVPGWVDLAPRLAYDVAAASKILDDAGWVPGPDGIRVKDGQRLSLHVVWSFQGQTPLLELIREELTPIGIELVLDIKSDAELGGVVRAGDWDLRLSDLTRPDPDVLVSAFASKYGNATVQPREDLDSLLERQSAAVDPTQRAALVKQLQELIVDQGYAFPILESSTIVGLSPRVHDFWLSTPRWPVVYDTWLEPQG